MTQLLQHLIAERKAKMPGGLYHKTQIELTYNSNRIEGSHLTAEQTRLIFETRTLGFNDDEAINVDDIIETSNHFIAFDWMLDTLNEPVSNDIIKRLHLILKTGTSYAQLDWFRVGEWKALANEVGGTETTLPKYVDSEMTKLNEWYNDETIDFEHIVEYHYRFEKIHPFQDGNGRVGRLIMFRECLRNEIVPFIIDEQHKLFYYRGLREFETTRGYLIDICFSAQDVYSKWIDYFYGAK